MRINHNLMAINTHRSYGINNANVAKSSEKLSSGYRINRAGDDAAGLAISEKMRAQIRGLNMASKNSQDAISLVQTTEGALQEVHNVLQRMRELAVQSASDTNDTSVDRKALALEVQLLKQEITAISEVTTFNGIGVLKPTSGLVNNYKIQSGANAADVLNLNIHGLALSNVGAPIMQSQPAAPTIPPILPEDINYDVIKAGSGSTRPTPGAAATDNAVDYMGMLEYLKSNGLGGSVNYGSATIAKDLDAMITVIAQAAAEGKSLDGAGFSADDLTALDNLMTAALDGLDAKFINDVNNFAKDVVQFAIQTKNVMDYYGVTNGAPGTTFTMAQTVADAQALIVATGAAYDMLAASKAFLGNLAAGTPLAGAAVAGTPDVAGSLSVAPKAVDLSSISVSTRTGASFAITTVNDAVNSLSLQRAQLGAYQNRLEHKIANLDTSAENLQAAESRIRDVDMAKEMTEFTKNNILAQAATAMLAQANQAPQGVLQLLR
jgi:flagellin